MIDSNKNLNGNYFLTSLEKWTPPKNLEIISAKLIKGLPENNSGYSLMFVKRIKGRLYVLGQNYDRVCPFVVWSAFICNENGNYGFSGGDYHSNFIEAFEALRVRGE